MTTALSTGFRFTIGRKIYVLIGLGFLGLLGIAFLDSSELASGLKQQKQVELQHLTELAMNVAKDEYAAAQSGQVSVVEAQQRAQARVATMRYGNNDYFFITDMQSKMLMHPVTASLVGTDMSNSKDPAGRRFIAEMIELVKQNGTGFVDYSWARPGSDKPQQKLSFAAGFAPWGWMISTGVYIDDLDAQTWASTQRSLIAAAVILLITLAVSVVMARRITKPLHQMTDAMKTLAGGRLDVAVPGVGRSD